MVLRPTNFVEYQKRWSGLDKKTDKALSLGSINKSETTSESIVRAFFKLLVFLWPIMSWKFLDDFF